MKTEIKIQKGYKLVIEESDGSWDRHEYIRPTKKELYYKLAMWIVNGFDPFKSSYCGNDEEIEIQKGKVFQVENEWYFMFEKDISTVDFWEETQKSDELAKAQDEKLRKEDLLKLNGELKSIENKSHKEFILEDEVWTWERVSRTNFEWQEELAQERREELEEEIAKLVKVK